MHLAMAACVRLCLLWCQHHAAWNRWQGIVAMSASYTALARVVPLYPCIGTMTLPPSGPAAGASEPRHGLLIGLRSVARRQDPFSLGAKLNDRACNLCHGACMCLQ
eukprot:jgi/Ulvmu1/10176/UM006_0132.1